MSKRSRAICCHCSVRCGALVDTQDGLPVAITGDPEHPTSKGFLCVRGRAAIEYFHHKNRLDHVLKRVGARGENRWAKIAWDDAIGEIADKLIRIRERDGPEAVAYFFGTFHGTDQGAGIRFMNLFGSPNYSGNGFICAGPKIEAEWLTFGFGPAAPDPQPGVTRAMIVWGQRASASNAPHWGRLLAAKRAGAKLIVIDPIQTAEARQADLWLPLRPNSDAALALGLLNIVISNGLIDAAFVRERTVGFEALASRAAEYPLPRVATATGLSELAITASAEMYAQGPSLISSGLPNGMGRNALAFERAKCALIAVTGNLDRPGGNRLAGPPARVRTKADLELYDELAPVQRAKRLGSERFRLLVEGYDRINDAARRRWTTHRYPLTASRGAIAHGPSVFRAIVEGRPYSIRALIIQHSNILGAYSNAGLVQQALRSSNLDLIVVQELAHTPTTAYADYVMPAASWMEKPYMYVTGENRQILATTRTVAPLHDRRSDYDFFRDLGVALDQAEHWPDSLEGLFDEMLSPAGITFAELSARKRNWVDDGAEEPPGLPRYGTPSGEVELASSIMAKCGYDSLPAFDESGPAASNDTHPLILMTGATDITMTHQDHRHIASLRKRHPQPTARLHSETASRLGFDAGDWIWIEVNGRAIRQRVAISDAIPRDAVDAERWWFPEWSGAEPTVYGVIETNVNVLSDDALDACDPAYGTWSFRHARCRVRKADTPVTPLLRA